jgi:hypothetical protein
MSVLVSTRSRSFGFAVFELVDLGAQHQVREIEVPFVRRHIGTFGHVAEVAQIAVVDHLPVIGFGDAIDFHRRGFIDQIEQCGKRLAQADAAAATVADVEHPLHFLEQRRLVEEIGIAPIQRVARGGFETAFANGHGRLRYL